MNDSDPTIRTIRIDADAIRVLAHPLRTRLLGLLRLEGPATATALAKALDTNTGATSYHLRKLAEVGLVEETGGGSGRERWWEAAQDVHSWSPSDFAGEPDAEAAREWLEAEHLRRFVEHVQAWTAEASGWPMEWRDAADASDYTLRLSPSALREMEREIQQVVERYQAEGESAGGEDAKRVRYYVHAVPELVHLKGGVR